tara:strand:+ start:390 stop:656 length:267 start_codon:yes stop_codon:yes gene_type:complete
MTKEYCDECNKEIDADYDEIMECSDCKEVIFCMNCAEKLQKYPPYVLMCQNCEMDYNDSMDDYDESAEREAIGDRDGGYDQYDNRNGR